MYEPLQSPRERPDALPSEEFEPEWAAFADALTDDQCVVVGQYGKLGGGPRAIRLAIAGNSSLHRLVELLRGIDRDIGERHGGLMIDASLDEQSPFEPDIHSSRFDEWAFVSVEFADGARGDCPKGPLLAAMTDAARTHAAAERMTARDLAVRHVGAPVPRSVVVRAIRPALRPLAAVFLAHRIPVIGAPLDKKSAWLKVAAVDAGQLRWLGDALWRVHSLLGEMRSAAVLPRAEILWERQHRSVPERCLGWEELLVELKDTAHPPRLRSLDLADAAQAVLDEEHVVHFG